MFTGYPVDTHESGTIGGIVRPFTASSLCLFQRNLDHRNVPTDGVSTYLALTFGTLLSSQGTDASLYSPSRAFLRAFPFGLAFPTLSDLSDPISSVLSRFPLSRFPFRRFRLYQILSGLTPSQRGLSSRPLCRSDE